MFKNYNVMRVIIADDSDLILDWLKEMLSAFNQVEIVAALKNGTDALYALRTLKPDLAIVDLKMPGLSGLEVLKEIRKVDKDVKFIILTFYAFDPYRQSAVKAGVDYFFSKTDDFEKVSRVVKELLEKNENEKKIPMTDF
jgi:two-component system response regulator YesN